MPQPGATEIQAKLRSKYGNKAGSTLTGGGKNAMRRKKFRQKKSTNEFEKRLQANLKKLSCNTIPGIEEVNLFKSDGTVIHFVSPKVDAEVSSNTFIVSGNYTHNKIEELLPDILPQIGSDHLTQLKDYAEKFEALKPNNEDDAAALAAGGDDGDVPMLIDEDLNFEQVAQSDEKKTEDDSQPAADAEADASEADKKEDADQEKPAESESAAAPTTTEATTTATTATTDDKPAAVTDDKPAEEEQPAAQEQPADTTTESS
eukprot:CAMPEP_0197019962 /NCGR_PEP_ID=MMETSP1384-20130603/606_1 /TAXON_ID=29189 /ORGANISM="Ammonia sp." /LENGTH=259 /DNA_ID=CAMNT_0042447471 /DNA_START=94 /DNA_END=873 /DNA_ORIENTATION=+